MTKLKQHLLRLLQMGLALGLMGLISFLPSWLLNGIGVISLVVALCLFCFMCFLYLKKRHRFVCVLLGCFACFSAFARDIDECASIYLSSVAEGNFCQYNVLVEEYGAGVCSFMKTFNPTRAYTGDAATNLQEYVNRADKIVQGYNELDEARQASLSGGCKLLTPDDDNKSTGDRLKILTNNNAPICCAWALQSKYQMYTAQNGERQIETVPMMLANDKMQCWPCDVVYLLITLANTMAYRSAPGMAAVGLFFLKWMLIFWIIIKIGCMFLNRNTNGKPYGLGSFLKELFARLCWAGLAALIISGTAAQLDTKTIVRVKAGSDPARPETLLDKAYKDVINPPFEMIAAMGIEMASALMRGEQSFYGKVAQAVDTQTEASVRVYGAAMQKTNYCSLNGSVKTSPMYQHITRGGPSSGYQLDVASQGRAISNETAQNLLCLTQLAFQGLAPISAAGSIITTHAIKNAWSLPFPLPGRLPVMPQLFYGLILMIVCWLLGVAVGFKVIDIMVRVAMVILLAPIFIVTAVFPLTRDKAKTALVFFISAIMGFVEVSIAVGMIVPCFYHAIATAGNEEELIKAMVAPSTSSYVPNLYEQFSNGGCKFFLFITVVGWMGFKMLENVSTFFEKIFGLQNVAKVGAGQNGEGSMMGAVNSVREDIGSNVDWGKQFAKDTGLDRKVKLKFEQSRLGKGYQSVKSAGGRAYEATKNKAGQVADKIGTAMGSGMQKAGGSTMKAGAQLSKTGYGAIIGVPMMIAGAAMKVAGTAAKVAGKAGRVARKYGGGALRAAGKFAKKQAKMGVYDFFHPNASAEDRDAYEESIKNK